MTAPDPRLEEIEGRLEAADLGKLDYGPDESGNGYQIYPHDSDSAIAYAHDAYDAAVFTNSPTDVAYLLAELRKAQGKLARVEGLIESPFASADKRHYEDDFNRGHVAGYNAAARLLRAALTGATGGDQ